MRRNGGPACVQRLDFGFCFKDIADLPSGSDTLSLEHKEVGEVLLVSVAHLLNGVHAGGADDGIAILGDNLRTATRRLS